MYNFRTDLASERREIYQKANDARGEIDGITSEVEDITDKIKVEKVKIINENGEKAIGKPIGTYITIDIKDLKIIQEKELQQAADTITKELKGMLNEHISQQGEVLVVGLGNIYVTPDSL